MKPAKQANITKIIAPPRLKSLVRTAPNGSDGTANGQAKIPIKTTPGAAAAAILNFIGQDNSII